MKRLKWIDKQLLIDKIEDMLDALTVNTSEKEVGKITQQINDLIWLWYDENGEVNE